MGSHDIVEDLRLCLVRAFRSDFLRDQATDSERQALSVAQPPITSKLAQDYAAWRRSVLYTGAAILAFVAVIQLIGFETIEDQMVDGLVEAAASQPAQRDQWGNVVPVQTVSRSEYRSHVRAQLGGNNLDILEAIPVLSLLSVLGGATFIVLAARSWNNVRRSRRFARRGWYILVGTPLFLAVVPWSRLLEIPTGPAAPALKSGLGLGLGLTIFFMLAPKLVSVFPGLIRSSIALKSLLHESATPSYVAALFAPVYAVFLVVIFTTVNQMQGDLKLLIGVSALAAGPMVYIYRGKDLLRSHGRDEALRIVSDVRRLAGIFNLVGLACLTWFILDMDTVGALKKVDFLASAVSGLAVMLVVGADFVVALVVKEYEQSKQLQESGNLESLETKIDALVEAGLGSMRTAKTRDLPMVNMGAPAAWGAPPPAVPPSPGGGPASAQWGAPPGMSAPAAIPQVAPQPPGSPPAPAGPPPVGPPSPGPRRPAPIAPPTRGAPPPQQQPWPQQPGPQQQPWPQQPGPQQQPWPQQPGPQQQPWPSAPSGPAGAPGALPPGAPGAPNPYPHAPPVAPAWPPPPPNGPAWPPPPGP